MTISEGTIAQWLAGLLPQQHGTPPTTAQKAALDKAKSDLSKELSQAQGTINTATNEIKGWAKQGVYHDDSYVADMGGGSFTSATNSQPAKNTYSVHFAAILNQPDSNYPTWYFGNGYDSKDGIEINMYQHWYFVFKSNKTGNNWVNKNTTYSVDYDFKTYLSWAYQFFSDPKSEQHILNLITAAENYPSDLKKLAAAYTQFKTDKANCIKAMASMKTKLSQGQTAIKTANAKYQTTLEYLINGKTPPPSGTSRTNPSNANNTGDTGSSGGAVGTDYYPPAYTLPTDVEFNLPPHKWSLPVSPDRVMGKKDAAASYDDLLRRGRFWFHADSQATFTQSPSSVKDPKTRTAIQAGNKRKFGFQFLWNPTSWSTSVQINDGVTPSSPQYWSSTLPVFPSGQQMDMQIVLDRVNDFAAFGPLSNSRAQSALNLMNQNILGNLTAANAGDLQNVEDMYNNYSLVDLASQISSNKEVQDMYDYKGLLWDSKIKDLLQRGTLGDLEYLYKTVNGDGWERLGQKTSDIGFLMMNLVEIEIGPSHYLGYLNSLNIEHQMFTPSMVPIRTNVSLSFVLMASARVVQTYPGAGGTANTSGKP